MPRRQYVADLKKAEEGVSIASIANVKPGDDDGDFNFLCLADGKQRRISALITDVSDYPSSHTYMIYSPDDVPASVARALEGIAKSAFGKPIQQLLELTSQELKSTDGDGDQQMLYSQDDDLADEDSEDDVDDYFPDDDDLDKPFMVQSNSAFGDNYKESTADSRARIRSDLLIAKAAGFKVGHLGSLMDGGGCYVTLSCRISKLGISEEAMQAWQVGPSEYLVVIFHYPNGYKDMDSLRDCDVSTIRRQFGMRIGISTTYKPTMQEAVQAFTVLSKDDELEREKEKEMKETQAESQRMPVAKGFRDSFISQPLHDLLENRFPQLLKYRYNGMPWNGAEEYYQDRMSTSSRSDMGLADKYLAAEVVTTTYPSIVTGDHITESLGQNHSLPLVGIQFVLRHFVRCTEFCLICFRKMSDDLQAIKPYVCEQPLCLYQYMSLGFGPSIEHEILSQPKVVDLLVSFCYSSARSGKLSDFPSGLSLMVPASVAYGGDYPSTQHNGFMPYGSLTPTPPPTASAQEVKATKLRYNAATNEILYDIREQKCPFRAGEWCIIRVTDEPGKTLHCRIVDTSLYPTVTVSEPVVPTVGKIMEQAAILQKGRPNAQSATGGDSAPRVQSQKPVQSHKEFKAADFYMYDQNFDDLPPHLKCEAIYALLDVLPKVSEMKAYLLRKKQSPLSSWVDRLPPAALGLLRWIIASNRACIMQVDEGDDQTGQKGQDRLCGMAGWSQFRFAMGAPDKERRFVQAVRDTSTRLGLKHDTLFAWHGSPLHNWHSIIREGLHFKDTAHGRAFGHGVYHSLEVNTSLGYSGMYSAGASCHWPMSELKVDQALALNEIVAAPDEFVSKAPHLVVAQLDWIQTRYLFVRLRSSGHDIVTNPTKETAPLDVIHQDKAYTPHGVSGSLIIPRSAIPSHRGHNARTKTVKRRKTATGSTVYDPIELDTDDDGASEVTLAEDREILEEEDVYLPRQDNCCNRQDKSEMGILTPNSTKGKGKATPGFFSKILGSKSSTPSPALTDYVPGTLDYNTLPMLQQPKWATSHATRRLMQDFKQMITVQNSTSPHELGWHIDEDKIENMYQWIVELHSFESTLPLAQDMKQRGVTSIVLEMRFGKDYPMSPPFVRVIRPRFLGFQAGGGGHVTAGGALCMELLTNNGWSAVSSIESVLLQVRMAMSSLDPKPARLENGGRADYGVAESMEAYIRACNMHGWTVPAGFREMAMGGAQPSFL